MNKVKKKTGILWVFIIAGAFSSCVKEQAQPTPLTNYNLSAYANGEFITFNANATLLDSLLSIGGQWQTNISLDYDLNFNNIKPVKGYIGNYQLGVQANGVYH